MSVDVKAHFTCSSDTVLASGVRVTALLRRATNGREWVLRMGMSIAYAVTALGSARS